MQLGLYVRQVRSVFQRQIDAIEFAAAPEDFLRGIHVHHREVSAEGARQAARFHDAANGEQLLAVHGAHRDFRAEPQVILARIRIGHHQRIGLGKENQRIVDGIVTRLQIVVAQAAIARHVDAQDQQIALPFDARTHHRFDHRHRDPHFRHGLHAIQNIFVEARFSRRDLQLRGARDAIHRLMKRVHHRLVRGVDADKHSHAQHNSRQRQQPARQMLPDVGPANEFQQDHAGEHLICRRDLLQFARRAAPPIAHSSRLREYRA